MIKVALLLSMGAVGTAKHHKNSNLNLYNQFLFCNSFLPFVRYLHCIYMRGGLPPIPGRMPEGGGPILSGRPGPPGPRCP